MKLQTPKQKEQARFDAVIYKERQALAKNPDNMMTAIDDYLMQKHNIGSRTTIWKMCKRAEARLRAASKAYYGDDDSRAE
jgi:hypothetical protein